MRLRAAAYALMLGLLCTACGGAAGKRQAHSDEAAGGAFQTIRIREEFFDRGATDTIRFGHLGSGEIAVQRAWIENASAKPVVILSVRRSCGCTSLDVDKQPLAPGESRKMEITFDSRGQYGWQLKNLDLILAGAPKPLRLLIEADVD